MKAPGLWFVPLGLVGTLSAQTKQHVFVFNTWGIATDGSKHWAGELCGSGNADADFRITITPRMTPGSATPFRMEADFVVHTLGDSALLVGDITAAHAAASGPTAERGDSIIRSRWDEESYRRSIVVRSGESAWFYPLGVPQREEEGVTFEISKDTVANCTLRADRIDVQTNGRHPVVNANKAISIGSFGIQVSDRLHRGRVRLEVGSPTAGWRQVYENEVLTRIPTRIPLGAQGARGQDMILELEAPEWGVPFDLQHEICWKWTWADHQPPGGGSCADTQRGKAVQRLFGSTAAQLRVTVLAAY
jgi:hypothetical protein